MLRNVSMDEISDGRLYSSNDLVKADCRGCDGCPECCCQHMYDVIFLDPYDIYCISTVSGTSFEELLKSTVKLTLADKILLPVLAMTGERECCTFLDDDMRCSIHKYRPGLCRLFPLGRYYHDSSFSYFIQTDQCKKSPLSKVKIKNWLGIPNLKLYESFICDWHYFLKDISLNLEGLDDSLVGVLQKYLLKTFYLAPYNTSAFSEPSLEAFTEIFNKRLAAAKDMLL